MRRAVLISSCVVLLAACQSVTPYYQQQNFATPIAQTRLTFDEAKTLCRARAIEHHWIGDTDDLNTSKYTACMASEGYAFNPPAKQ